MHPTRRTLLAVTGLVMGSIHSMSASSVASSSVSARERGYGDELYGAGPYDADNRSEES